MVFDERVVAGAVFVPVVRLLLPPVADDHLCDWEAVDGVLVVERVHVICSGRQVGALRVDCAWFLVVSMSE